jgi:hypothetical protein
MSLQSWKDEFYPVEASEIAKSDVTDLELIEHSIRKWEGLKQENLDRHEVVLGYFVVYAQNEEDSENVDIDCTTCALCERHLEKTADKLCATCPVYLITGDICFAQYSALSYEDGPKPMIDLLNLVKDELKERT